MQAFLSTDFVSTTVYGAANDAAQAASLTAKAKRLAAKHNASVLASKQTPEPVKPANRGQRRAAASTDNKPAPAVAAKPAKPSAEARAQAQADTNDKRRLERDVSAAAVAAFYSGASLPFKAASDRFADLNFNNAKSATARQAGLMLALITYGSGNMLSDGTFTRGGFNVPARLVNKNAKPNETVRAQPESGCFGNLLGRAGDYVSGPKSGREQASAIYRLRVGPALSEIAAAFGDKQRNAAAKLLASYPAKRA